ncbi:MAG TPA: Ig-like domain-containing protein, partial [Gemmatimonadaceae bacterium]|nr:Ig-like domain-containing protein [Gemmatimonadaceae bacterium]
TILLYDNGALLPTGPILADGSGNWSVNLTFASVSTNVLTAKQVDAVSGFTSTSASSSVTVKVYVQPAAPGITAVSTPSATSTATTVTVTGTGVNGYGIQIYDNGVAIGTSGLHWSGSTWTVTVSLAPGVHSLTATQTQVTGVTSNQGNAVSVTVAPAAPTSLGAPANVVSGNPFTIAGKGIAGATITLYDNGVALSLPTITVDASGNWSANVILSSLGTHALTATQTDNGVTGGASSGVSVKAWAPPSVPTIAPASVYKNTITVSGTGTAGQTITIYANGVAAGTATVASNGTWSFSVKLASGTYSLTATQTLYGVTSGASGAVSATIAPGYH